MKDLVALPGRAPSSTTNGAGVSAALSQLFIYVWNGYTPLPPLGAIEAGSITIIFVYLGAWVTKEKRYYMDRRGKGDVT